MPPSGCPPQQPRVSAVPLPLKRGCALCSSLPGAGMWLCRQEPRVRCGAGTAAGPVRSGPCPVAPQPRRLWVVRGQGSRCSHVPRTPHPSIGRSWVFFFFPCAHFINIPTTTRSRLSRPPPSPSSLSPGERTNARHCNVCFLL